MNFVAIDVETANADMASICSVGAVKFESGEVTSEWYSLVDPQDYFDGLNVSIHGIDEERRPTRRYFRYWMDCWRVLSLSPTLTLIALPHTRLLADGRLQHPAAPGSIQHVWPAAPGQSVPAGAMASRMFAN